MQGLYLLDLSAITMSRLCKIDATKRKIEHMPNMTVMGNALTFKNIPKTTIKKQKERSPEKEHREVFTWSISKIRAGEELDWSLGHNKMAANGLD